MFGLCAEHTSGDPSRTFLCGHSAGGHLVSLTALHPQYLREVGLQQGSASGFTIRGVVCWI